MNCELRSVIKFFFHVFLSLSFIFLTSLAQKLSDEKLHAAILSGIDYTLKQDYNSAKNIFNSVMKNYPTHPVGYIYFAGVLQAEFSDYQQHFEEHQYDSLLTIAQSLTESMIENKSTADWGYYFAGTALAYRSFNSSETGNWLSSISHGISSAKMFERCLELNPKFYDAMNGLGTYYYWRSVLSWIPFVSDKREEGKRLILSTISSGTYETFVAKNSLMLIYIEEKKYIQAEEIAKSVVAQYSDNRSFLWGLMTIYEQSGNKTELRNTVAALLTSVVRASKINYYNEATCRIKLAQYAMEDGKYNSVIEECEKIIALKKYQTTITKSYTKKISLAEELLRDATMKRVQQ